MESDAHDNLHMDFADFSNDAAVDEARALRIVLGMLELDVAAIDRVHDEVRADKRGFTIAHWTLVTGLARAYAAYALSHQQDELLADGIRLALTAYEGENDD